MGYARGRICCIPFLEHTNVAHDSTQNGSRPGGTYKGAASDQSIKHAGLTGQMIRDLALQILPSKLKAKKQACPLSPAHCRYLNEGIYVTYEYILSSTIKPTNIHSAKEDSGSIQILHYSEAQRISTP
jgi:hypothetical protein